jgi:glucose-6-phosphate isomerase
MDVLKLESISGLPMSLDGTGLVFEPEIVIEETKVRLLDELTPVALDPEACRGSREIAYHMYNGVYHQNDADRLAGIPLRYELTLIPARRLNREFVKTFGHLHTAEPSTGLAYAEVCEVLVGTAHFFLQTLDLAGPSAAQTLYIKATAGDKIIIPPDFDHLTINPGPGPLLFSDVIALNVRGIYERYRATHGAAYLEVVAENEQAQFRPNPTYRAVSPLRQLVPQNYSELHLTRHEPLYTAFVQSRGKKWSFLTNPSQFWSTFPDLAAEFSMHA